MNLRPLQNLRRISLALEELLGPQTTDEERGYVEELQRIIWAGGQRIGKSQRAHVSNRGPIVHISGDIDQVLAELRKKIAEGEDK